MNPHLGPRSLGLLFFALALGASCLSGRGAPPAAKPKGPADEALQFDSWKIRMLASPGDESLKVSEAREDPEKVNGGPCVAYDFEGTITGKLYPLLVGRLDVPSDMSQHHAVVFSYKILVKSADKPPSLQFELYQANGQKGAIHGTSGIVMDETWQEVEVPLAKLREAFKWDLSDVGAIGIAPRFPLGSQVNVTLKFGGFRLVK